MTALSISADNGLLNRMRMRVPGDRVSKHHPREGTETQEMYITESYVFYYEFLNIIPARGRKLYPCCQVHIHHFFYLVSKHHPREGTETYYNGRRNTTRSRCVSKHHPREGTETRAAFGYCR